MTESSLIGKWIDKNQSNAHQHNKNWQVRSHSRETNERSTKLWKMACTWNSIKNVWQVKMTNEQAPSASPLKGLCCFSEKHKYNTVAEAKWLDCHMYILYSVKFHISQLWKKTSSLSCFYGSNVRLLHDWSLDGVCLTKLLFDLCSSFIPDDTSRLTLTHDLSVWR